MTNDNKKPVILVGYSGHAYVIAEILLENGYEIFGYCENEPKSVNPYRLRYLGNEMSLSETEFSRDYDFVVAIGDNSIRRGVQERMDVRFNKLFLTLEHGSAIVSSSANIGNGCVIAARVTIQAQVEIADGTIINTGAIVEHGGRIGAFCHIAPGAVLCGGVTVGDDTLIGAGSVILPGIQIGSKATIGAGSVVTRNIPDGVTVVGNPARIKTPFTSDA